MSLKFQVAANSISQIYVALITILMVPMYVRYMGSEVYGLVGFFTMLLAWFQLLDLGMTPALSRQTACYRGGAISALALRKLFSVLEKIFGLVALCSGLSIYLASRLIATRWLDVVELPHADVIDAIHLMALTISLRLMSGLYRGGVTGFEELAWLGGFNAIVGTMRFVVVVPVYVWMDGGVSVFFVFQLIVAVFEVVVIFFKSRQLLPSVPAMVSPDSDGIPDGVLRFALSIAFTSGVWVLITQTDKLILSSVLPLTQYGHFTVAVLIASGVMLVSGPIASAVIPRMVRLGAQGDDAGVIGLYRAVTQISAMIALPAAAVLSIFSYQVLWLWTGSEEIAKSAAPLLSIYALGNGVLAMTALPYYLQFAKANLKLHLVGNIVFASALIPALIVVTRKFGAIGAAWVWLVGNSSYFLLWIPLVHRRLIAGLHCSWLLKDVGMVGLSGALMALLFERLVELPTSGVGVFVYIVSVSFVSLMCAAMAASSVRQYILALLR